MQRYHVIDALMLAGLLALIATCFTQAGFSAALLVFTMFVASAYLGYKSAFVQLRREAEQDKKEG